MTLMSKSLGIPVHGASVDVRRPVSIFSVPASQRIVNYDQIIYPREVCLPPSLPQVLCLNLVYDTREKRTYSLSK